MGARPGRSAAPFLADPHSLECPVGAVRPSAASQRTPMFCPDPAHFRPMYCSEQLTETSDLPATSAQGEAGRGRTDFLHLGSCFLVSSRRCARRVTPVTSSPTRWKDPAAHDGPSSVKRVSIDCSDTPAEGVRHRCM